MNHNQWMEQLYQHLDGEGNPSDSKQLEEHLSSCDECRRTFGSWQRIQKALFNRVQSEPSDSFVNRVMGSIDRDLYAAPKTGSFSWRWLVPGFSMAMAALLLALTFVDSGVAVSPEDFLSDQEQMVLDQSVNDWLDM